MAAADAGRPWWASGEGTGQLGDDDPVAAHRSARAGAGPDDATWWSEAAEILSRAVREAGRAATGYADHVRDQAARNAGLGGAADAGPHPHAGTGEVCHLCPVCAGLRAFDEARPEVVAHLTEAARHVTLAARALLDAQAESLRRPGGLERIDLDEE
jgi:hypothetical protein